MLLVTLPGPWEQDTPVWGKQGHLVTSDLRNIPERLLALPGISRVTLTEGISSRA